MLAGVHYPASAPTNDFQELALGGPAASRIRGKSAKLN